MIVFGESCRSFASLVFVHVTPYFILGVYAFRNRRNGLVRHQQFLRHLALNLKVAAYSFLNAFCASNLGLFESSEDSIGSRVVLSPKLTACLHRSNVFVICEVKFPLQILAPFCQSDALGFDGSHLVGHKIMLGSNIRMPKSLGFESTQLVLKFGEHRLLVPNMIVASTTRQDRFPTQVASIFPRALVVQLKLSHPSAKFVGLPSESLVVCLELSLRSIEGIEHLVDFFSRKYSVVRRYGVNQIAESVQEGLKRRPRSLVFHQVKFGKLLQCFAVILIQRTLFFEKRCEGV
mmetsp:Transcript_23770/g.44414  ORF Transcript_23770/g.44414 Transcript_23770/m.44414 type:complete len:291 (-) Transcript_23770:108-980(-)